MITGLCFSKNRAMQLDLLLRSLQKNAPYITDIRVLYLATDQFFNDGYEILKQEHPHVKFIPETDFYEQVFECVETSLPYYTGIVDESICFRPVEMTQDRLDWVFKDHNALTFSLRIGQNLTWQNHWHSESLPPINVHHSYKDLIMWDATEYNACTDLGRNLHCDCTVVPNQMYLQYLKNEPQENLRKSKVRSLDGISSCGHHIKPSYMASYTQSCFVNIAVTLVHLLENGMCYADNWGHFVRYDVTDMNKGFLNGLRIDLDSIPVDNIDCGRMETQFNFYQKA